jgi:hypothetical protein
MFSGAVALLRVGRLKKSRRTKRCAPEEMSMTETIAAPRVGDKMPDGTVFAGTSPDTGVAMYATPADAPLTYTFYQAMEYAAKLDAHGHRDWRVPTLGELEVLFQNRAGISGFNETGLNPESWYWSSSQTDYFNGWGQRFSDGYQTHYFNYYDSPLRCVRG